MRWATRAGIHVDRTACAWLIRRFIDHQADLSDERYDAPEARGLDVILRGLSLIADSDEEMLQLSRPIYDGPYEYRLRATMLGRERG